MPPCRTQGRYLVHTGGAPCPSRTAASHAGTRPRCGARGARDACCRGGSEAVGEHQSPPGPAVAGARFVFPEPGHLVRRWLIGSLIPGAPGLLIREVGIGRSAWTRTSTALSTAGCSRPVCSARMVARSTSAFVTGRSSGCAAEASIASTMAGSARRACTAGRQTIRRPAAASARTPWRRVAGGDLGRGDGSRRRALP